MDTREQPARAAQAVHLLKIGEVLARLRVSRSTFYLLVRARKLRILKINGASRVLAADVDTYIANLPSLDPSQAESE